MPQREHRALPRRKSPELPPAACRSPPRSTAHPIPDSVDAAIDRIVVSSSGDGLRRQICHFLDRNRSRQVFTAILESHRVGSSRPSFFPRLFPHQRLVRLQKNVLGSRIRFIPILQEAPAQRVIRRCSDVIQAPKSRSRPVRPARPPEARPSAPSYSSRTGKVPPGITPGRPFEATVPQTPWRGA